MAGFLSSRRIRCFYCGSRTAFKVSAHVRQFDCEQCLATNYLDENGEITDPPAATSDSPASAPVRYARLQSPSPPPPSTNVFCDVCLKNQHLYKENLALYLPEPHDVRYKEYLASLPAYKRKLEERYPQVCPDCAPRARERIKQAGYVAKTDHLRRMMAGTRNGTVPLRAGARWRIWVIRLGGLGWWSSAMAQLSWHLMGAVSAAPSEVAQQLHRDTLESRQLAAQCMQQAWRKFEVQSDCVSETSSFIPLFIVTSLLTIWWNPHLTDKYLRQRKGRMKGLLDYFVHGIVLLAFRTAGWWMLKDANSPQIDREIFKAGHVFMVVFIIFTMGYGSTLVKLDSNPIVSFHVPEDQILPGVPERDPSAPPRAPSLQVEQTPLFGASQKAMTSSLHAQTPGLTQRKPVSSFRPQPLPSSPFPSAQRHTNNDSFAPVAEPQTQIIDSDPDAMDWSPSVNSTATNFRPRVTQQVGQLPGQSGPSPFQARVPAAPLNRMRHPKDNIAVPVAPAFQKPSEAQKRQFFNQITQRRNDRNQSVLDAGYTDTSAMSATDAADDDDALSNLGQLAFSSSMKPGASRKGVAQTTSDFRLGPQRLFLKSDDRDTGLESMFDEVFSFREEPSVVEQSGPADSFNLGHSASDAERRGGEVFGLGTNGQQGAGLTNVRAQGGQGRQGLLSALLIGLLPAIILGVVAVGVKLWNARVSTSLDEL